MGLIETPEISPAPPGAAAARHDPFAALRFRDFRLLVLGSFLAVVAEQMLGVAVGWELYERTRVPAGPGVGRPGGDRAGAAAGAARRARGRPPRPQVDRRGGDERDRRLRAGAGRRSPLTSGPLPAIYACCSASAWRAPSKARPSAP